MGKVIKLNRSGTVGVSLIKEAKEHGFVAGADIEQFWCSDLNGIVLKIALAPSSPVSDAKPIPAQETP